MKKFLLLSFMLMFTVVSGNLWAQERTVSGKVTSVEDGSALPGVNVVLKGTTEGTVTDVDGNYSLSVPSDGGLLVFSFIGLASEEVEIGARSVIDLSMSPDVQQLSEVVVLAYGATDKTKTSAAVSTVEASTISQVPNASLDQILQGQAPGLNIQTSSGQPGAAGTIILRGRGSINGNIEPLFIIDGVPVDEDNFRSLNSNDIENVSILKDASASALYGSRGANGVIVVTTKKGSYNGGVTVQYRGQYGVSELIDPKVDFLNSQQLLELQREADTGEGAGKTDAEIAEIAQTNTSWTDIFFDNGQTQSHEINVTAGTENTTSYSSVGYFIQEGITRRSELERVTFRSNMSTNFDEKVTFSTTFTANYSKSNFPEDEGTGQLDNPFLNPYLALPFLSPFNDDGSLNLVGDGTNGFINSPYIALSSNELDTQEEDEFKAVGNANIDYQVIDNLHIGANAGFDYTQIKDLRIINPTSLRGDITPTVDATIKGSQFEAIERDLTQNYNAYIKYGRVFNNKHTIDVSLYSEYYNRKEKFFGFTGFGIDPKLIGSGSGITPGTTTDVDENGEDVFNYIPNLTSFTQEIATFSYFGILDYDFDSRFGAQVSVRRDASSRFESTNRWGTFWSVSGRWNITRDFFQDSDFVNDLKLRVSYGAAGNSRLGGGPFGQAFAAFTLYNRGNGYQNSPAYFPAQIGNPDLSWETTYQLNIGLDFTLWKSKIYGTLDVYDKQTEDVFLSRPLSRTSGFTSISANVGELSNRGVEVGLNYDIINLNDLKVSANINFAYNRNIVERLADDDFIETGRTALSEGERFGTFFLTRTAGINPANGRPLYLDTLGNVTETFSNSHRVLLDDKSRDPLYTGGFGANAQWKGFSLNVLFSYALDQWRNNGSLGVVQDPGLLGFGNQSTDMLRSWRQPGDITDMPSLDFGATRLQLDDRFLEDASFVRLRNVVLAYQLSDEIMSQIKVFSGIRIYVQGQNLLTWTEWRGFDPESNLAGSFFEFPAPRTYTVGLDLNF